MSTWSTGLQLTVNREIEDCSRRRLIVIDLSGFTGPVRIGFKYVGSGPGGQTTTFRVENVKVTNL